MILFHYTCRHSWPDITAGGVLVGNRHPLLPGWGPLIWLTDFDWPDRAALGLTSHILGCDRTEFRCVVDTELAVPWPSLARDCPLQARRDLDGAAGARPRHWWLIVGAVRVPILPEFSGPTAAGPGGGRPGCV